MTSSFLFDFMFCLVVSFSSNFPILIEKELNFDYYIKSWNVANDEIYGTSHAVGTYNINSQLFHIIGGYHNETTVEYSKYRQTYSIGNNSIRHYKSLPLRCCRVAAQSYTTIHTENNGSYLYFSNFHQIVAANNFYIFDLQTNQITQIGFKYPKIGTVSDECYANDGITFIYLIGGSSSDPRWHKTSYFSIFDIQENKWSAGPSLNLPRSQAACVYVDHMLFVSGYGADVECRYSIEYLNVSSAENKWTMVDNQILDNYMRISLAFYPSKYMLYQDIWTSNTIFLIGNYYRFHNKTSAVMSCYKFNFRSFEILKCNSLPKVYVNGAFMLLENVQNENRLYLFSGTENPAEKYHGNKIIQYAVLDSY
eukprot:372675_1